MVAVLRNETTKEVVCEHNVVDVVIEVRFDGRIFFVCKHQNENENAYFDSEFYELLFPAFVG